MKGGQVSKPWIRKRHGTTTAFTCHVRGRRRSACPAVSFIVVDICVWPTTLPVGKSHPADLALAEDRPNRVKKSLLSSVSANLSEATVSPRPRFRRIGQWPQGACSPSVAIRGTPQSSSTVVRSCPPA